MYGFIFGRIVKICIYFENTEVKSMVIFNTFQENLFIAPFYKTVFKSKTVPFFLQCFQSILMYIVIGWQSVWKYKRKYLISILLLHILRLYCISVYWRIFFCFCDDRRSVLSEEKTNWPNQGFHKIVPLGTFWERHQVAIKVPLSPRVNEWTN